MIGRPVRSNTDAIEKFTKLADKEQKPLDLILEVKYDGERTQIHYNNGEVNLFSRNFESQNQKFWLLKERLELHFQK